MMQMFEQICYRLANIPLRISKYISVINACNYNLRPGSPLYPCNQFCPCLTLNAILVYLSYCWRLKICVWCTYVYIDSCKRSFRWTNYTMPYKGINTASIKANTKTPQPAGQSWRLKRLRSACTYTQANTRTSKAFYYNISLPITFLSGEIRGKHLTRRLAISKNEHTPISLQHNIPVPKVVLILKRQAVRKKLKTVSNSVSIKVKRLFDGG